MQDSSVSTIYIAHKTEIDAFRCNRTAMSTNEIEVGSGESEGIDAKSLQLSHDVLVDQTTINHCDNAQHISISDSSASYHLGFDTELCCHFGCRTSAAMYQNLRAFYLHK